MIIFNAIAGILNFIGILFITNKLGNQVYGQLVGVMALMATVNLIADLGFDSAHVKRISEGQDQSDCLATYTRIKILLIVAMTTVTIGMILAWPFIFGSPIQSVQVQLILTFLGYNIFADISSIVLWTFVGRSEMARYSLVSLADPLIRVPLYIVFAIYGMDVTYLALASLLGAATMACVSVIVIRRSGIKRGSPRLMKSYLVFAIPISIISIIGVISVNIDKLTLGFFYGDSVLGTYSAASILISMITVIASAIGGVTYPAFSQYISEGNNQLVRQVTMGAEKYVTLLAYPILAFFIIFATPIIQVLYSRGGFSGADLVLQLLSINMVFSLANIIYSNQINAFNRPSINSKVIIVYFILFVTLMMLFTPKELFGVPMLGLSYAGPCLALILSTIFSVSATRYSTWKLSGSSVNPIVIWILGASLLASGAAWGLMHILGMVGLIGLLVGFAVAAVAYLALLAITKVFTRHDLDLVLGILNIKHMLSYITTEVKGKK